MRHRESVQSFLTQQGVAQKIVQEISGRINSCASTRGWIRVTDLETIFNDGALLNEYDKAYGTDPKLRFKERTVTVVIEDVPQALARVVSILSGRGYNIDHLSVSAALSARHGNGNDLKVSHLTLTTICSDAMIAQIVAQLKRPVNVLEVQDLTDEPGHGRARISLVKVNVSDTEKRAAVTVVATLSFRAKQIRTRDDSLLFRFAGSISATDAFFAEMQRFGRIETSTALVALS